MEATATMNPTAMNPTMMTPEMMQQLMLLQQQQQAAKEEKKTAVKKAVKTGIFLIVAAGAGALAYKLCEDYFADDSCGCPAVTPDVAGDMAAETLGYSRGVDFVY